VSIPFVIVPIAFVGVSAGGLGAMRAAVGDQPLSDADAAEMRTMAGELCTDLDAGACMVAYMGQIYLLLFLMMPAILPTLFAAYSIAGERAGRTLEPLLATPIRTWELVFGKAAAAVLPSMAATWLGFVAYALMLWLVSPDAARVALTPAWFAMMVVVAPLVSGVAVEVSILVSSRVADPRAAQQIAGMIALPLVLMLLAQAFGVLRVDFFFVAVAAVALTVVDAVLLWFTVQVFERENILTRHA
jgi:ABC-2 type transport system permease protein